MAGSRTSVKKLKEFDRVMQFKVTLLDISPPVWRRIQVPETYTFWDLHVAIQDAMGWLDYHLHAFTMNDPKTGEECEIGIPDEDGWSDIETLPGWELAIAEWFTAEQSAAPYLYDFGDSWEHLVELEEVLPRSAKTKYPICVDGARACPPEDCGGVWGYEEFLNVVADANHEDHEEMLEWVGGPFDPEHFDKRDIKFWDPRERWKMAFG